MSKLDPGLFSGSPWMDTAKAARTSVLAIGSHIQWPDDMGMPDEVGEIAFSELHELTEAALIALNPGLILSPVVAPTFDCVDVATLLRGLGYRGSYRALTGRIPNPEIIRREIRAQCPGLDFDVIMVDRVKGRRAS
ncbi:MAG: hypothetical protein AAGB18_07425 [Pseudomonadota bacterium]